MICVRGHFFLFLGACFGPDCIVLAELEEITPDNSDDDETQFAHFTTILYTPERSLSYVSYPPSRARVVEAE